MSLLRYPLPRPASTPRIPPQIFKGAGVPPSGTTTNVSVVATQPQTTVALAVLSTASAVAVSATQNQPTVVHRRVIRAVGAASQPQTPTTRRALSRAVLSTQATTAAPSRAATRAVSGIQAQGATTATSGQRQLVALQGQAAQAITGGHSTKALTLTTTQAQGAQLSTSGRSSKTLVGAQPQAVFTVIQPPHVLAISQAQTSSSGAHLLLRNAITSQEPVAFTGRLTMRMGPIAQSQAAKMLLRESRVVRLTQPVAAILVLGAITPPSRHPPITYPTVAVIARSSTAGQIIWSETLAPITGPQTTASIPTDTRIASIPLRETTDTIQTAALGN